MRAETTKTDMDNDDLHKALVVIFESVRRAWDDAAPKSPVVEERLSHVYAMVKQIKHVESESERMQRLEDIMQYIREGK